ncbi:MAG: hypothetical protein M1385_01135 [Candidatus Marsarchaeota archaeon]|nr:hypothetical protein [Candidatus Marsarchaeota archaeon]
MSDQNIGVIEPNVDMFSFSGTMKGSFDDLSRRLSTLQNFSLKKIPNGIMLYYVESRDIQKKPFLFQIIKFSNSNVEVDYSILKDSSEKLRKLHVLRGFIGIISLITDIFIIDTVSLFQYIDSAIDDTVSSLSKNYSVLFNNYDSLLAEYREMRRLNVELSSSNKNLTVESARLNTENEQLKGRLKELENYSDESLMVIVQDWIESHDNTIDINEFSKTYKVVQPRVEQILNKMVTSGYIEAKG